MGNRTEDIVSVILKSVRQVIVDHDVTYDEYQTAKQWLIDVGESEEWPLLLDVFIESTIEEQAFKSRMGSVGTILGPFYLPDAPVLEAPYEMPRRPDEKGDPLVLTGRVVSSADGRPLPGAVLDVWQADAEGRYSGFSDIPEGILRGKVVTDGDGRFQLRTIAPGPYTIPHEGPTGRLIAACGWHPWRPAHIHLLVGAEGHESLTTQLYSDTSAYLDDDIASAVKKELIIHPERHESDPQLGIDTSHLHADYDFSLDPARERAAVT